MINVKIPGRFELNLKYAIFDMNGTLTTAGILPIEVKNKLIELAKKIKIIILTADTFGKAKDVFSGIDLELHILKSENTSVEKLTFIESLGSNSCVTFGNGYNDRLMIEKSALGIVVLGDEGTNKETLNNADIVVNSVITGINLLLDEKRLIATLRN